jgi:hypothetical protein
MERHGRPTTTPGRHVTTKVTTYHDRTTDGAGEGPNDGEPSPQRKFFLFLFVYFFFFESLSFSEIYHVSIYFLDDDDGEWQQLSPPGGSLNRVETRLTRLERGKFFLTRLTIFYI